jgi:hypothetical protein
MGVKPWPRSADERGVIKGTGAVLKTARIKLDGRDTLVFLPLVIGEDPDRTARGFLERFRALYPQTNRHSGVAASCLS